MESRRSLAVNMSTNSLVESRDAATVGATPRKCLNRRETICHES
jgi:hypothetical protein